ncbi:MAG: biopolymer transporter ExbD [Planctomycetota bacterium]
MKIVPEHRPIGGGGTVPMTSMIDVVFLLLIFFMVTASFSAPEDRLAAGLQAEGNGARTQDLQPQIVDVRMVGDGPAFVIGSRAPRTRGELTSILRLLSREQGVVVRGHAGVPVSAVATAMQAASDAGFEKRSYVPAKAASDGDGGRDG